MYTVNEYMTVLEESSSIPRLVEIQSYDVSNSILESPAKLAGLIKETVNIQARAEEYVYLVLLSSRNEVVGLCELSHGTVSCAPVSNREIMLKALLCGAVKVALVHNHPSGVVEESKDDVDVFESVQNAGRLVNIEVVDSIIVAKNEYKSLAFGVRGNVV